MWTPDGGSPAAAGRLIYRTDTWNLVDTIPDLRRTPSWSPDGSRLAYLDNEAALRIWDRATGESRTTDDRTWPDEYSLCFRPPQWSPGGQTLAASTGVNACCVEPE